MKLFLKLFISINLLFALILLSSCGEETISPEIITTNMTVIYTNANGDQSFTTPKLLFADLVGSTWTDVDHPGGRFRINPDGTWTNYGYFNGAGTVVLTNDSAGYFVIHFETHDGDYMGDNYGTNYTNRYTIRYWRQKTWVNTQPVWSGPMFEMTEITAGIFPNTKGFDTITAATNASTNFAWYGLYREINP